MGLFARLSGISPVERQGTCRIPINGWRDYLVGMYHSSRFSPVLALFFLAGAWALPAAAQSGAAAADSRPVAKDSPARPAPRTSPGDEFVQMDTNGDGRVSGDEYAASPRSALDRIAAGKRLGPVGLTGGFELHNNEGRPDRSRFFRELDLDHDGYLNRNELGLREPARSRGEDDQPKAERNSVEKAKP